MTGSESTSPRREPRWGVWVFAGVAALVVLLAGAGFALVLRSLLRVPEQRDFDAYYVGARMLDAGRSAYAAPLQELLGAGSLAPPHREYVYPPFFAALLRPLARLPYRAASTAWLAFNVGLAALLVPVLGRLAQLKRRELWLLAAGVLLMPAVYQTWLEGQVSILVAMLLALGILFAQRGEGSSGAVAEWTAGVSLGIAGAIKVYPVLLLPVFAWHRRWRLLAIAIGSGMAATALGAVLSHGLADTIFWFQNVLPAVATREWPANQSLLSVVTRLAPQAPLAVWNGSREVLVQLRPLLSGPAEVQWIVRGASLFVLAASVAVVLRRRPLRPAGGLAADYALSLTVVSIIPPVVWDHYYVQLAVPIVVLFNAARRDRPIALLLLGALACLVVQRFWRQLLFLEASGLVLMSGLLGVILLWIATLRVAASPARAVPPAS